MGLVQMAGGTGVFVQPDAGDGPPPRAGRAVDAGHVRGHDMGVQQRITGPAGAMIERGRHHPRRADQAPLATTLAGEHRVGLVVADNLINRFGMRTADLPTVTVVGKRPQHAHALGRPQRQVITRASFHPRARRREALQLSPAHRPSVAPRLAANVQGPLRPHGSRCYKRP